MTPYYQDARAIVYHGDALAVRWTEVSGGGHFVEGRLHPRAEHLAEVVGYQRGASRSARRSRRQRKRTCSEPAASS